MNPLSCVESLARGVQGRRSFIQFDFVVTFARSCGGCDGSAVLADAVAVSVSLDRLGDSIRVVVHVVQR